MKPLLIYVCTPLNQDKFNLKQITEVCLRHKQFIFPFIPPIGQLSDKKLGAQLDKTMIELCNEMYVFGNIGRDCAWEIGYAAGLNKPITIFIDDSNKASFDDDWMTVCKNVTFKNINEV